MGAEQLLLNLGKALKGASRVEGRPGMWWIEPSKLNDRSVLTQIQKDLKAEAQLAERPGGVPSIKGHANARGARMMQGAIEDMVYANKLKDLGGGAESRGLVYIAPSGKARGAAAFNTEKAGEYLGDPMSLDFTAPSAPVPTYLEYVGVTSPEVRGRDLLRAGQQKLGNHMVFQVATPKVNDPIYRSMGAVPMPKTSAGLDVLGGSKDLPAYEIRQAINETRPRPPIDDRQLSLPGFQEGGEVYSDSSPGSPMLRGLRRQIDNGMQEWLDRKYFWSGRQLPDNRGKNPSASALDALRDLEGRKTPLKLKMAKGGLAKFKECNCHG